MKRLFLLGIIISLLISTVSCSTDKQNITDNQNSETQNAKHDHNWESSVITAPTSTTPGIRKFTCTVCGDTYQEEYELTKYSSEEIYAIGEKSTAEITTFNKKGEEKSLGTGFVIGSDGRIVTNFHVIDEAYSIQVKLGNMTYTVDKILAYSEDIDLAVLKIPAENLPTLETSTELQAGGATIYALGSSEGYTLSFSSGTVASPERTFDNVKYIQHNAAISHGNSGGPLFNVYGQVIGVNTSTNPEGQNLNFAIAVSEIDRLPKDGPFTMEAFYEKEGPYFETFIGDYVVYEKESNDSISTAQIISVNGTTISGNINKSTDIDYFKVSIDPGKKLTVLMVPDSILDGDGILCGLKDSNNVIAAGSKQTVNQRNTYTLLLNVLQHILYISKYRWQISSILLCQVKLPHFSFLLYINMIKFREPLFFM